VRYAASQRSVTAFDGAGSGPASSLATPCWCTLVPAGCASCFSVPPVGRFHRSTRGASTPRDRSIWPDRCGLISIGRTTSSRGAQKNCSMRRGSHQHHGWRVVPARGRRADAPRSGGPQDSRLDGA